MSQVSSSAPWCSLARAFEAIPAGRVVLVRTGAYPQLTVSEFAPTAPVTFEAYPGETPTVDGIEIGGPGVPSHDFTISGLKIIGPQMTLTNVTEAQISGNEFAITPKPATDCTGGPPATAHCVPNTANAITLRAPLSHLTISDNQIHDGAIAIAFTLGHPPSSPGQPRADTYQDIDIAHNTFSRMGDVVISVQNFERVTIADNTFAHDENRPDIDPECHCDAIHAIGGGDALTIAGNLVYGGRGFLLQPSYSNGANCAPVCLTMTHAMIADNVLVGKDFGIRIRSSPGVRVINNTIEGPAGPNLGLSLLYGSPPTTGAVVANNLISYLQAAPDVTFAVENFNDIGQRGVGPQLAPLPAGDHDIVATPRYVNPGAHDYAVAPGSPGYRQGSALYAPPLEPGYVAKMPVSMGAFGGAERVRSGG